MSTGTTQPLSREEAARYSRHLTLPGFGAEGQARLKAGRMLIIGAGGLGSPAALYLAAAGVGTLGMADPDVVDVSNLQRQILHDTGHAGAPKIDSAAKRLRALNPGIEIVEHREAVDASNALDLLKNYDIILDGSDNFVTRYLVNDACVLLNKPLVHGSIFRFEGVASVFHLHDGPCYRCLYPSPPAADAVPDCATGGVLGVLPGVIGTIQATEAIKIAAGIGVTLSGRVLLYDALTMRFREMTLTRDPACPVCGEHPTITRLEPIEMQTCTTGRSETGHEDTMENIHPVDLKKEMNEGRDLLLLDVREPHEIQIGKLPDAVEIPLGQLPERFAELPRDRDTVVYCRSGGRSAKAVQFLMNQGFPKVRNLAGGTLAWSDHVDPSLPKY